MYVILKQFGENGGNILFLLAPASLEENKHYFFKANYFEKLEIQLQVEWRQVVLQ